MSVEARAELTRLAPEAARRGAVPHDVGEFLHLLVLAGGYRRGLEIGAGQGYSGLWIGSALAHNGGVFTTIDNDPDQVVAARTVFQRAGLDPSIEVVCATAENALQEIHGPFDFVFIDADMESVQRYFDLLWPKLAQRATIVTDHVLSNAAQLSGFAQHLRRHPSLCSALVRIGAGLEVSLKLASGWSTTTLDGADWII